MYVERLWAHCSISIFFIRCSLLLFGRSLSLFLFLIAKFIIHRQRERAHSAHKHHVCGNWEKQWNPLFETSEHMGWMHSAKNVILNDFVRARSELITSVVCASTISRWRFLFLFCFPLRKNACQIWKELFTFVYVALRAQPISHT